MYQAKVKEGSEDDSYLICGIRDYSKAIHLDPSNYLPYIHRGRLLLEQRRLKESQNDLMSAYCLNNGFGNDFVKVCKIKTMYQGSNLVESEYSVKQWRV